MAGASGQQTATPNINQASAQALYGGGAGTVAGMGYTPQQVQAGQLASTNIAQYQNPYTQQVIDAQAQDVLRNAQLGLNQLSGQAQQARAFGGSRHGVAMGEIGRGVAETLGQQSAGLRQAGFQQAQQMAQQDIASRMQADLANQQMGLAGAQHRLGASSQLANLGNLGFGISSQIQDRMMQQGAMQQAIQQQLIDQAKQQYMGYTGAPAQSLGYVSSAIGASPVPQTTTTSRQPGLFDYLTLASQMPKPSTSDKRLKKNITKIGKFKSGLNIYKWEWKEGAEKLGADMNHTIGVIAQEVKDMFPNAVVKMDNGYYAVKYSELR